MTGRASHAKSGWGPVLKHVYIGHLRHGVPDVMLVSQNARFFKKHIDCYKFRNMDRPNIRWKDASMMRVYERTT